LRIMTVEDEFGLRISLDLCQKRVESAQRKREAESEALRLHILHVYGGGNWEEID